MRIGDFDTADKLLGKAECREIPGRDTYLLEVSDPLDPEGDPEKTAIAVRYSKTQVLTFLQDGSVILYSGPWQTVTTVNRLNSYGPRELRTRLDHTDHTFLTSVKNGSEIEWEGFAVHYLPNGQLLQLPDLDLTISSDRT